MRSSFERFQHQNAILCRPCKTHKLGDAPLRVAGQASLALPACKQPGSFATCMEAIPGQASPCPGTLFQALVP